MTSIKSVAVAGASGNLGPAIIKALLDSGKFSVTILTRTSAMADFPSGVNVFEVDYDSLESLTSAFKGQDAVVCTVATMAQEVQMKMIDAAVAVGVKRYIPSEFGSDLGNLKTEALPVFGGKVAVTKYLEKQSKAHRNFSYTVVRNGAFLDWGLKDGFVLDMSKYTPTIYDGGDQLFSLSNLATVGTAVAGTLMHLAETANRAIYIQDTATSQNHLLHIAKKLTPGKKWEPISKDLAKEKANSDERISKGIFDMQTMLPNVYVAILGEGYGGLFQKLDNELLGVKGITEAELEDLVKAALPSA